MSWLSDEKRARFLACCTLVLSSCRVRLRDVRPVVCLRSGRASGRSRVGCVFQRMRARPATVAGHWKAKRHEHI